MPARPLVRRRRTPAALTAGALCAPLLVLGAPALAAGEATPPPAQSTEAFCTAVPADYAPFTDIDGNRFHDPIECIAAAGIARGGPDGQPPDRYGPELGVDRDAMASFLVALMDKADQLDRGDRIGALPRYDGSVGFTDVSGDNVHREAIDRLAEAGVVRGGPGGRPAEQYGPGEPVNRAQLASFVVATLEYLTGDAFSVGEDFFTDDADAAPHGPRINAVAAEGIATGDGADAYRPFETVRRDQMAAFLARTLAVLEADGDIDPLS
jgi:hypothetical protein